MKNAIAGSITSELQVLMGSKKFKRCPAISRIAFSRKYRLATFRLSVQLGRQLFHQSHLAIDGLDLLTYRGQLKIEEKGRQDT